MEGSIRWTLIVPSHNGEDTLSACLSVLHALRWPEGGHEVILVDNASTDGTRALLEQFSHGSGAIVLSEPRKGKSYALNRGIERAAGAMLLFLDDDVIAEPGLIAAYDEAAREYPEAGVFAGQVRPRWSVGPPEWLAALADAGRCCGCTPVGRVPGWLEAMHVKGGNMAVRRSALGAHRFATVGVNFGDGARATGGEDTDLARRLAASGSIRFVSAATVHHLISPREMSWRGVFTRYVRIGRGNAALGLARRSALATAGEAVFYAAWAAAAFVLGRRRRAASEGIKLAMRIGAIDHRLRSSRMR